jgi:hypothetical protein
MMDNDIAVLKRFAEYAFGSLERTCEGLTEKEADWKPAEETNDARWILNHLSRISNTALPRIFKGDPDYTPEGWPEDYREQKYDLDKLLGDIATGKEAVLEGMGSLSSADLAEDIPLWGGTRKREFGIFAYLGEIINHKGQIAALKGIIKRRREKDASFLV